ncbi:unnamed protein product [Spirodela intermedia]|uniref:Uncharacterized protein n=1 Tax=Spirodela intermedia TaxID=51605 RepID=A0A7I8IKN7_SPIIN|nr:unnamed protein product [Spirodela intermedia]CAA6658441.1 unnamed protein product [Spirodela intermedia]
MVFRLLGESLILSPLPRDGERTGMEEEDKQADYAVKVKGVQINPNPVVRGKPAKFSLSAITGISAIFKPLLSLLSPSPLDSFLDFVSWLMDLFLSHVTEDGRVASHETFCPGSYTLTMKLLGQDESQLSCVSFDFKIRVGSPVDDD